MSNYSDLYKRIILDLVQCDLVWKYIPSPDKAPKGRNTRQLPSGKWQYETIPRKKKDLPNIPKQKIPNPKSSDESKEIKISTSTHISNETHKELLNELVKYEKELPKITDKKLKERTKSGIGRIKQALERSLKEDPHNHVVIARHSDGSLAGVAHITHFTKKMGASESYVNINEMGSTRPGNGAGTAMVNEHKAYGKRKKVKIGTVVIPDDDAKEFYKKRGYKKDPEGGLVTNIN